VPLAVELDASESLRNPYVWSAGSVSHVCIEPQSHGVGAPSEPMSSAITPMARLAPGESLSGWLALIPKQIATVPITY
jgi:aldose 1-epimerase